LREREQWKLNLVIRGVEEPADNIEDNRERAEEDKGACGRIFRAMRARATRSGLKFCRRLGKRRKDPRPVVIGLYNEEKRRNILDKARDLQHTKYRDVNFVPDITRKQRRGDKDERRSRQKKHRLDD
jgi:hypothetical protein